jgi:hypothetical protein
MNRHAVLDRKRPARMTWRYLCYHTGTRARCLKAFEPGSPPDRSRSELFVAHLFDVIEWRTVHHTRLSDFIRTMIARCSQPYLHGWFAAREATPRVRLTRVTNLLSTALI